MLPSDLRLGDAQRIVSAARSLGRIPLHFARREGCFLPHLVPAARAASPESTMGAVFLLIRREMKLAPHRALFVFLPFHRLVPVGATVAQVYAEYADGDGLLRLIYSSEDAFG